MKNVSIMGVHWKIKFLGGVHEKSNFWGGLIPQCTLCKVTSPNIP